MQYTLFVGTSKYDRDIQALLAAGINVSRVISRSMDSLARGEPLRRYYYSDEEKERIRTVRLDVVKPKSKHCSLSTPEAEAFFRNIKKGYRSQFCKILLRATLPVLPIGGFLDAGVALPVPSEEGFMVPKKAVSSKKPKTQPKVSKEPAVSASKKIAFVPEEPKRTKEDVFQDAFGEDFSALSLFDSLH